MVEKIGESLWRTCTRKNKVELEDKELIKALARFDKTDEQKPEPRLEALQELAKEIPRQLAALAKRKKELGDKTFGLVNDELNSMLEKVRTLEKKIRIVLAAEHQSEEEDEDSWAAALVDPKVLLRQLNMCRQHPERSVKFAYVDAKNKSAPAMLALHPRMSARALFAKLQAAAGVKTGAYGTAWVDAASLMLRLDKPLSGLAKKVRPLVKACGFKISKAVIWDVDGTVFEQDDLSDEAVGAAEALAAPPHGDVASPTAPVAPPSPAADYEAKLSALMPRVRQAQQQGSADAARHEKLLEFAAAKAKGDEFFGALAALAQVEQLLANPTPPKPASGGGNVEAGVVFKTRLIALIQKIKEAQTAGHPAAQHAKRKASEAGGLAGKRNFEQAGAVLDELEALLQGREETAASAEAAGATAGEAKDAGAASANWETERNAARMRLAGLAAAIRAAGHVQADLAMIEISAVYAQLRGTPHSLKEVNALVRYLETDDVLADIDSPNSFDIEVNLREPLLEALDELAQTLS